MDKCIKYLRGEIITYRKTIFKLILLGLGIVLLFCAPGRMIAQNLLTLEHSSPRYNANPYIEILEDPSKQLTVTNVASPQYSEKFSAHEEQSAPNYSYTESAIWLRIRMQDLTENQWIIEIGYPLVGKADFYAPDGSGGFLHKQAGTSFTFNEREFEYKNVVFRMPPTQTGEQVIFIRAETQAAMITPITIWEYSHFIEHVEKEYLALGIYYGAMALFLILSIILSVYFKEKIYFYYFFFVFSISLYLFIYNGLAFQYLWPNNIWWAQHSINLSILLSCLWGVVLTRRLMPLKKYSPFLNKLLIGVGILILLAIPLVLTVGFTAAMKTAIAVVFITATTSVYAIAFCLHKKYRPARYVFLGWLFLGLGSVIMSGRSLGILEDSFITMYGAHIGFTFQIIFVSLGMVDHMFMLNKEKQLVKEKNRELRAEWQRLAHMELLNEMSNKITFRDNIYSLARKFLFYINKQVYCDSACFMEKEKGGFKALMCLQDGSNFKKSRSNEQLFKEDLFYRALKENKTLIISEQDEENSLKQYHVGNDVCSVMIIPLSFLEKWHGVVVLENKKHIYSRLESSRAMSFAAQAGITLENVRLFQEVKKLSVTDELTGLYNRRYLFRQGKKELSKARRYSLPLSLIILDIDDFKKINDKYGHSIGDQVLKTIAQKCKKIIRDIDIACRYGGEEFVLMLPGTDIRKAETVSKRIRRAISSIQVSVNDEIKVTASFGISAYADCVQRFEELINNADYALLEAKSSGKDAIKINCLT